jgi:hypothetical protein
MNKTEAENKIQEIHEIFHSGHRLAGSPSGLIVAGIVTLLLAAAQWISTLWEIGKIGGRAYGAGTVIVVVAMFLVNFRGKRLIERDAVAVSGQSPHPLIKQTFGVGKALFIAGIGLSVVWCMHTDRLMVVWMVMFGVLTHLWGRFIHGAVERFAYVLILGGIAVAALGEFQVWTDALPAIATAYLGVWTIGLGLVIKRYQRA